MSDLDLVFRNEFYNRIKHHPPLNEETVEKHRELREKVYQLGLALNRLVPKGREQDVALTKLEELLFWGNAGIARNQGGEDGLGK